MYAEMDHIKHKLQILECDMKEVGLQMFHQKIDAEMSDHGLELIHAANMVENWVVNLEMELNKTASKHI